MQNRILKHETLGWTEQTLDHLANESDDEGIRRRRHNRSANDLDP